MGTKWVSENLYCVERTNLLCVFPKEMGRYWALEPKPLQTSTKNGVFSRLDTQGWVNHGCYKSNNVSAMWESHN